MARREVMDWTLQIGLMGRELLKELQYSWGKMPGIIIDILCK